MKKWQLTGGLLVLLALSLPGTKTAASTAQPAPANVQPLRTVITVANNNGAALWQSPQGQMLTAKRKLAYGTSWKVYSALLVDQTYWYNLGGVQWVSGADIILSPKLPKAPKKSARFQPNVVKVTAGTNVFSAPAGMLTGDALNAGTYWKIHAKRVFAGKMWYQVGTGQWIKGDSVHELIPGNL